MHGLTVPMRAIGEGPGAAPQPRLVRAAHEFEGQMMQELLKPMMTALAGTGSDSGADSNGALEEFAAETLGNALSAQGGFGIADQIVKELSHSGNQAGNREQTGKVTAELRSNTRIRASE
jgi:Rod binding domain-containing protein